MYFNHLESLEERIAGLLRESRDPEFTKYLFHIQKRVADQKQQAILLAEELNRNEQVYRNNMQLRDRQVPVRQSSLQEMQQIQVSQPVQQPVSQPIPQGGPAQKRNAEFTIGAAVLSIVGSVFVLAALVMLGMYFMTGLFKGLILYAGCILVMVLAEVLVYRRWPKLGMTLSAIGVGGLYISTLVNYLALGNFNQWIALGVTIAITLMVVMLSRKRDAVAYRILGMSAMYVCILMVIGEHAQRVEPTQTEFLTVSLIAFIVNIMCLVVPVKKSRTAIHVTHLALNTGFTFLAYINWTMKSAERYDTVGQMWQYPLFVALSILVMQLIFVAQIRWNEKQNPGGPVMENAGICVAYGISGLVYALLVSFATDFGSMVAPDSVEGYTFLVHRFVCSAIVVAICMVPLLALRQKQEKWFAWYLMSLLIFVIHAGSMQELEIYICLLVLLVISKLLSFTKNPMLRISDAVITTICCLVVLVNWKSALVVPILVALLLSVLCINYWKAYFETILTFTIAFYCTWHMLPVIKLPVFVGIMFVAMLIFNNVKRWSGSGIEVFNCLALTGQVICYLLLVNPVYRNAYLTYLCMLIFGVSTIIVCFQKQYNMDFGGKHLVLAIFLTYMGLVVRTGYPIVNSILLMTVALGCVGAGFAIRKKAVRIYGLVLSLVVCAKLVLYDFMGVNPLQRTILFFAVGVLALMIAGIYMVLERNREKQNKQEVNEV